jgi:hypothetical protein
LRARARGRIAGAGAAATCGIRVPLRKAAPGCRAEHDHTHRDLDGESGSACPGRSAEQAGATN